MSTRIIFNQKNISQKLVKYRPPQSHDTHIFNCLRSECDADKVWEHKWYNITCEHVISQRNIRSWKKVDTYNKISSILGLRVCQLRLLSTNLLRAEAALLLRQLLVVIFLVEQFVRWAEKGSPLWAFLHAHYCSSSFQHKPKINK